MKAHLTWAALAAALAQMGCGSSGPAGGGGAATGNEAGEAGISSESGATPPVEAGSDTTSSSTAAGDAADSGDGGDAPGPGRPADSGDAGGGTTPPQPTAVCGTALLMGPATAPAGAVVVMPGAATIQAAIAAHPAGTTYYLSSGTYPVSGSINPQAGDTFIGAPGAVIDGSGTQPVAFGLNDHAANVTLRYLTIQHFAGPQNNGIVNQGQGAGWTIEYCTIENNPDTAGGADGVMLGDGNVVRYSCFSGNAQTGIAADGATGITVDHNEVTGNAVGYETKHNCGCSGGMKFFTSTKGVVTSNWIHDNGSVGLWVDTNNSFFLIDGNVIENSESEAIMYEISYNAVIRNNVLRGNGILGNPSTADFPEPAIYLSESGGFDAGAAVVLGGVDTNGVLSITGNQLVDNADGVVLYQNATRCCGTRDGCTSCAGAGGTAPLYMELDANGNQRWKTQNVTVANNTFTYDATGKCVAVAAKNQYCSVQAMFSTSATVDQDIAFHQNNVFKNNTYTGPWTFLAPDQGSAPMAATAWQAAPFAQDVGSTFK